MVSWRRMVRAARIELTARGIDGPKRPAKPPTFRRVALVTSLLLAVGCSSGETPEVAAVEVENAFGNTQDPKAVEAAQADMTGSQTAVDTYMAGVEAEEEEMARLKAGGVAGE